MWSLLSEWCADVLAGTARRHRLSRALLALLTTLLVTAVFLARWGVLGALPPILLVALLMGAGREVFVARDRLWNAATLSLEDARQPPRWDGEARLAAPTAVALNRLAVAIDAARRGRYVEANDTTYAIDRQLLRPEEIALLEAVRALVCLGLGDTSRAAQLAVLALPTGVPDVDVPLGRAMVADAWRDPQRLLAIDGAWGAAGVHIGGAEALSRLRALVRLRVEPATAGHVPRGEAAALSDEARAVGDEDLATELSAQARRSATYR